MPVTVTVTISSTIQDSIKLNDADIRGGGRGRDLTDKEMEMVAVTTMEEAVRTEEESASHTNDRHCMLLDNTKR